MASTNYQSRNQSSSECKHSEGCARTTQPVDTASSWVACSPFCAKQAPGPQPMRLPSPSSTPTSIRLRPGCALSAAEGIDPEEAGARPRADCGGVKDCSAGSWWDGPAPAQGGASADRPADHAVGAGGGSGVPGASAPALAQSCSIPRVQRRM